MSASTHSTKVSRSVAIDKRVAQEAQKAARAQNRSFSNYVETLLAAELSKSIRRKPHAA